VFDEMTPALRRWLSAIVVVALAGLVAACGATLDPQGTVPGPNGFVAHPAGLGAVRSPVCGSEQLRQVRHGTPRSRMHLTGPPFNTRKTAVRIKLGTVLVVTVEERVTEHLTLTTGCWVRPESHIKHGVMTVAFLMNHLGYPILAWVRPIPNGAEVVSPDTYLHVVRQ
jgi:hypothetical protein